MAVGIPLISLIWVSALKQKKCPKSPLRKYLGIKKYFHFFGAVSLASQSSEAFCLIKTCATSSGRSQITHAILLRLLFHKERIVFFSQRASLSSLLLVTRRVWL